MNIEDIGLMVGQVVILSMGEVTRPTEDRIEIRSGPIKVVCKTGAKGWRCQLTSAVGVDDILYVQAAFRTADEVLKYGVLQPESHDSPMEREIGS